MGPPDLFAPPARSRRTMMERPWRSELWRVAMALFAASVDSKSTRPQPLDLPPGCLATSDWTTVPTWEQWAVRELGVGIGSWVSGLKIRNIREEFPVLVGRFRRSKEGAPGAV